MTRNEYDEIKPMLLDTLRTYPTMEPMDMFNRLLDDCKLSEHETKEAIGRLLDDQYLLFTKDRKFRMASPEETLARY